ncbi:hypothetical protein KSP39_PZI015802 [Platanthera zijinensis]|uniref:Reverse transcriptase domain-containing protein n=1 Tax=Platanthera zijinensis TaxID=2320716 RepID=A0AAP0B8G7_9ASPA
MRVTESYHGQPIHVLIDSGSTHNFVDEAAAQRLQCTLVPITPFSVAVANGKTISSSHKVDNFQWVMQGVEFISDVLVLPLGGCDVVLGIQWLITLGMVHWNFADLRMEFSSGGKHINLRGAQPGNMTWSKGKHLQKLLPPIRGQEHHIVLTKEGVNVNLRPYRYPPLQKSEIERLISEMLQTGVIRHSCSPFASPVVLVKKKDGSWRLCVDYRQLNHITVKDKFPIHLVEELIDELHGARYFSKLDLRAGYHQVRMAEEDIQKTAFRTHQGHYEFLVMPFGLTNAPSTFQSLMNRVFQGQLRKFIIIFFDDILIFSATWEEHLEHLKFAFHTLCQHQLVLKRNKCDFGLPQIHYLGHIISGQGVATDPTKIQAMLEWPTPTSIKRVRGFLGLTDYYRRFIQGYGTIAQPLTELLKHRTFRWTAEAEGSFQALKRAVTNPPVLILPNFQLPFTIETNASDNGVGAVLLQQERPVAFFSKAFGPRNAGLSTYEKELLAIVMAVQKWRHYVMGSAFIIRTDHHSLKFMLEQKLATPAQQRYLSKLMGYDFKVHYKRGNENVCADALSRIHEPPAGGMHALTLVQDELLQQVRNSWSMDTHLQRVMVAKERDATAYPKYDWKHNILTRKGKIVVGRDDMLRNRLLNLYHAGPMGGHSGVTATYKRIKRVFYWKGLKAAVYSYIQHCTTCQQCKADTQQPAGLLQPLPIPGRVWQDIGMDFIDGLPLSHGKTTIMVVVDRLSKHAHFIALSHPYTAETVARVFLDSIVRLHGPPHRSLATAIRCSLATFGKSCFGCYKFNCIHRQRTIRNRMDKLKW